MARQWPVRDGDPSSASTTVGARHRPAQPRRARRAPCGASSAATTPRASASSRSRSRPASTCRATRSARRCRRSSTKASSTSSHGAVPVSRRSTRQRAGELFELRGAARGTRRRPRRATPHGGSTRSDSRPRRGGRSAADRAGGSHELPALNTQFHDALAAAAGNDAAAPHARTPVRHHPLDLRGADQPALDESWDEHAAIVDAVAAGDVDRARRCGEDHIACRAAYGDLRRSALTSEAADRAAVDADRRAGDERGPGRAQERHDVGELLGRARPPERDLGDVLGAHVVGGSCRRASPWRPRTGSAPACRTGR